MTQSSRTCTKCGGEKVSIYARICHLCGAESESTSKTITSASPEPTKPLVTTTWSRGESIGTNTPITPVDQTTAQEIYDELNEDVTQRTVPVTRVVPDWVCARCGASNTRYRTTLGSHVCQRCGHEWAQKRVRTNHSRNIPFKGLLKCFAWVCSAITCLGTLAFLVAIADHELDDFLGFSVFFGFFFVLSIVAWRIIGKIAKNENKLQSEQLSTQSSETYVCQNRNCGNELSSDETFCTQCGRQKARPLTASEFLVCGACGREITRNVKFCPGCGTQAY